MGVVSGGLQQRVSLANAFRTAFFGLFASMGIQARAVTTRVSRRCRGPKGIQTQVYFKRKMILLRRMYRVWNRQSPPTVWDAATATAATAAAARHYCLSPRIPRTHTTRSSRLPKSTLKSTGKDGCFRGEAATAACVSPVPLRSMGLLQRERVLIAGGDPRFLGLQKKAARQEGEFRRRTSVAVVREFFHRSCL